jgi:hypothetical protein
METIFDAIRALHAARKPISRENIRTVLETSGRQVDEKALDALVAFVDAITTPGGPDRVIDPWIVSFLISEIEGRKPGAGRPEPCLAELNRAAASVPVPGNGGDCARVL